MAVQRRHEEVLQDPNFYFFSVKHGGKKKGIRSVGATSECDADGLALTSLLLSEGDVGVDQTPGDAAENQNHKALIPHRCHRSQGRFLPDIQAQEVGPGEDVVSSKHHPQVGHQDVLHKTRVSHTSVMERKLLKDSP